MLGTFNLGEITTVETGDGGALWHNEADVTLGMGCLRAKYLLPCCCIIDSL